jgi:hypothetical protein
MNKLQTSIKNKINSMRCSGHNQQPEVKISGDKINFDCCCDSFKYKTTDAIAKVTKDFIKSELKGGLK